MTDRERYKRIFDKVHIKADYYNCVIDSSESKRHRFNLTKRAAACILIFICVGLAAGGCYAGNVGGMRDMAQYGRLLHNSLTHGDDSTIVYKGRNAEITAEEIDRARAFYASAGEDDATAYKHAVAYCEEYEALYEEAVRQGYSASQEEISERVEEMKKTFASDSTDKSSKEQYQQIMSQFDSEDEYWDFQAKLLKKSLPIMKMNHQLEMDYTGDDFDSWYKDYKTKLVKKEHFRKV